MSDLTCAACTTKIPKVHRLLLSAAIHTSLPAAVYRDLAQMKFANVRAFVAENGGLTVPTAVVRALTKDTEACVASRAQMFLPVHETFDAVVRVLNAESVEWRTLAPTALSKYSAVEDIATNSATPTAALSVIASHRVVPQLDLIRVLVAANPKCDASLRSLLANDPSEVVRASTPAVDIETDAKACSRRERTYRKAEASNRFPCTPDALEAFEV
jgi:hypothetical protein